MQYYQKLDLPGMPFLPNKLDELLKLKTDYSTQLRNVKDFLSPAMIEIFDRLGVIPNLLADFGYKAPESKVVQAVTLHTDLTWNNNEWQTIPCSINWELVPCVTNFYWWDTQELVEQYPPTPAPPAAGPKYWMVNGIHYGARGNKDTSQCKLIDTMQLKFQEPVLMRTDIAHTTDYKCEEQRRIGISLKFTKDQIPTWEHGLEIFRPIFKK